MYIITLLSLCLLSLPVYAQSSGIRLEKEKRNLELTGKNFVVYSFSCDGSDRREDTCGDDPARHLFWADKTKEYYKRIDNCGVSDAIELAPGSVMSFFRKHESLISKEVVKPVMISYVKKTKKGPVTLAGPFRPEHECFYRLQLSSGGKVWSQTIPKYAFEPEIHKSKNINAAYNMQTKVYALIMQIQKHLKGPCI